MYIYICTYLPKVYLPLLHLIKILRAIYEILLQFTYLTNPIRINFDLSKSYYPNILLFLTLTFTPISIIISNHSQIQTQPTFFQVIIIIIPYI